MAITGFVLGLVSLLAWIIPLCGFPITITGIVFSSLGLFSTRRSTLAKVGLALSILALVGTLINSIIGAIHGMQAAQ